MGAGSESAREREAREFVEKAARVKLGRGALSAELRDGVLLCLVVRALDPSLLDDVYEGPAAYRQMENVTNFVRAARELGVERGELCTPVAVHEERETDRLVDTILALKSLAKDRRRRSSRWSCLGRGGPCEIREDASAPSKLNQGSYGVMRLQNPRERLTETNRGAFGRSSAGMGRWQSGSHGIMQVDSGKDRLNETNRAEFAKRHHAHRPRRAASSVSSFRSRFLSAGSRRSARRSAAAEEDEEPEPIEEPEQPKRRSRAKAKEAALAAAATDAEEGWLSRSQFAVINWFTTTRESVGDSYSAARESVAGSLSAARDNISERFGSARSGVEESIDVARHNVEDSIGAARHNVEESLDTARHNVEDTSGSIRSGLEDRAAQIRETYAVKRDELLEYIATKKAELEELIASSRASISGSLASTQEAILERTAMLREAVATKLAEVRDSIQHLIEELQRRIASAQGSTKAALVDQLKRVQAIKNSQLSQLRQLMPSRS